MAHTGDPAPPPQLSSPPPTPQRSSPAAPPIIDLYQPSTPSKGDPAPPLKLSPSPLQLRRGHHLQHRQSSTYASQPRPPTEPHPASPLHYPHHQAQLLLSVHLMNYYPQRKWNADISTVPTDSTVQSRPVTALDRDTDFNTLNCIDSVLGASYPATCSAPSWTSTAHPRQPFTMAIWTTGYEIHNESTLRHAVTYSNSIALP